MPPSSPSLAAAHLLRWTHEADADASRDADGLTATEVASDALGRTQALLGRTGQDPLGGLEALAKAGDLQALRQRFNEDSSYRDALINAALLQAMRVLQGPDSKEQDAVFQAVRALQTWQRALKSEVANGDERSFFATDRGAMGLELVSLAVPQHASAAFADMAHGMRTNAVSALDAMLGLTRGQ